MKFKNNRSCKKRFFTHVIITCQKDSFIDKLINKLKPALKFKKFDILNGKTIIIYEVRMFTGYFGNLKNYPQDKGYKFVSIARFNKFWRGDEYKKLAPPVEIIKIEDENLYTKIYYEKVLNKLNPRDVLAELGENAVLLCYEKWDDIKANKTFCHRRIVAKWLENNLGIKVDELKVE